MTLPDPLQEPTISVACAGRIVGLGRSKAYVEARRYIESGGAEGLPAISFARTIRCPTRKVLELVGLDEPLTNAHEAPSRQGDASHS